MLWFRLQNNGQIVIHYFHYEDIVTYNNVFIIVNERMQLIYTLYPIETKSSIDVI